MREERGEKRKERQEREERRTPPHLQAVQRPYTTESNVGLARSEHPAEIDFGTIQRHALCCGQTPHKRQQSQTTHTNRGKLMTRGDWRLKEQQSNDNTTEDVTLWPAGKKSEEVPTPLPTS